MKAHGRLYRFLRDTREAVGLAGMWYGHEMWHRVRIMRRAGVHV